MSQLLYARANACRGLADAGVTGQDINIIHIPANGSEFGERSANFLS